VERGRVRARHWGRALGIGLSAAALALALIPSAAQAAPTTIPPTRPGIDVRAEPGTENVMSVRYQCLQDHLGDPDENGQRQPTGLYTCDHIINDSAGISVVPADPPQCFQEGAYTASCYDSGAIGVPGGSTGTGEDIVVSLGDQSDLFEAVKNVGDMRVSGGPGNDIIGGSKTPIRIGSTPEFDPSEPGGDVFFGEEVFSGGRGNDVIFGFAGVDSIKGGPGKDKLDSGADNDFINAKDGRRDKKVSCGPGKRDVAVIDKADSVSGCEKIKGV
jgi:hypothetical protein